MFKETLEKAKNESCFQVLMQTARLVNEEGLRRIRAKTKCDIRASHLNLFPHIDLEGSRLTDLATATGITKQAVNQLVNDLEAMGFIERLADPEDGRAKLITFSQEGRAGLFDGLNTLAEMEAEILKSADFKGFEKQLLELNRIVRESFGES